MKKDERITIEDSILKITNELLQEWEERFQNISIRNDIPFVNRSHDEFDYFSEIDIEEKAYWLGFIYADGYVTGSKLGIAIANLDRMHLEKFKKWLRN